jgi:hypothetical protein
VGLRAWNAPGVERTLTIEEMKFQAEWFYEGLMQSWTATDAFAQKQSGK